MALVQLVPKLVAPAESRAEHSGPLASQVVKLNTQGFKVVEDQDVDGTCCSARGVCRTTQVSVIGRSDSGRAPQRHITSSTST